MDGCALFMYSFTVWLTLKSIIPCGCEHYIKRSVTLYFGQSHLVLVLATKCLLPSTLFSHTFYVRCVCSLYGRIPLFVCEQYLRILLYERWIQGWVMLVLNLWYFLNHSSAGEGYFNGLVLYSMYIWKTHNFLYGENGLINGFIVFLEFELVFKSNNN